LINSFFPMHDVHLRGHRQAGQFLPVTRLQDSAQCDRPDQLPMGPANEFPTVDSGASTWHGAAEPRPTSTFERVMKAAMERFAGVSHLFVITCS
jgi:hypothetical protein